MVIRTNMSALRAFRERGKTTRAMAKNLEKLSSGLRINRASDDAAGLGISEKIRANITELARCQSNVEEGLDLARTADGALQEVNDMLCRARGLCIEAENGTYSDQERAAISDELNQLFGEIDRITASSKFNTIPLFRGGVSDVGVEEPDPVEDIYYNVYDETYTTLEPNQLERWGQMTFVKDKDFEPAASAIPASVEFKLANNMVPSDPSTVLEGKSITVGDVTYHFTSDPTGISRNERWDADYELYRVHDVAIDLTQYTTVKDAVSALALTNISTTSSKPLIPISEVSITDDGIVTLTAALKDLPDPVYADGKLVNYTVPNGNAEYFNGTDANNPIKDQTLGQIDGLGNTNNPVKYSTPTIDFDISKLPDTLTQSDVDSLKANSIRIYEYYQTNADNITYNSASTTISLTNVNFTAGMTRKQVADEIVKAINNHVHTGFTYTATCSQDGQTLSVTASRNGYSGPMYAQMSEIVPPSTRKDDPDPSHTWTSTASTPSFTLVSSGGMESGPEIKITIPQLPSGPFSFSINGYDHLYYNSNTHPLSNNQYTSTHYSSTPNYRHDTSSMSASDIQNDVINQITSYYQSHYGSDIAGIFVNGNTITITGNPNLNSKLPTTNLFSSWTTTVTPCNYVSSSKHMLSDSTQYFSQNIDFSFNLKDGIGSLVGKGFSTDSIASIDSKRYQYFEFTNGPGTGVDSSYTDIDISNCTTAADVAAAVKAALTSSYNVAVTGDTLTISVARNNQYYYVVTDGAEGIIADGSVKFSGGVNTGHSQTELDFSSINASNLDTLLGKGFRINCATCEGEYINVFFCWEDDGTVPKEFQRLDESTGEMRTIHNIPVELSKVTSGEKIVESIVSQVRPSLTHYTDVLVGTPPTTLIAMEKRTGDVLDKDGNLYLGKVLTGVETNFTYSVEVTQGKWESPQPPEEELPEEEPVQLKFTAVQIYAGAGIKNPSLKEPWYIPVHLPYIDLKSLNLRPPEQVDLNAADQDAADWLNRVDRANLSISDARGTIGADYNRLEHAFQALSESEEQLTDAESRIRDADVAELMVENVKLQILTQSQQSMLAQANSQPQQVLQLLM